MTLQTNKIHQGDCVENLKRVEAGSVDLIFADPPFNIGYKYDVYDDRQQAEDYLDWCRQWIEGCYQALKPTGTFWLAIGDEFAAELKIEAQKAGFHCRSWVIWYYTFGVNCVNGFTRSHTHIFHFVKDKKKFTFNRMNPQIRVPSARQLVYGDNRANPAGRLPDNTWILRPQDAPTSFGTGHDTWYFARVAGTFKEREGFHGCQMPEQLLARIIRSTSNPQELVLDPFGGSGTTMCVAKKLGRQYIGLELSEEYVKYINERIERINVGDPINGPEDPISSAPSTKSGRQLKKPFSDKVRQTVQEIFAETSDGYPAEYLLCDQTYADAFYEGCRKQKLGGNATVWNRYLQELNASGKLASPTQEMPQLSPEQLAAVRPAAEAAWRLLAIDFEQTLQQILTAPKLAAEFDRLAIAYGDDSVDPKSYRLAAWMIGQQANRIRESASALVGSLKWDEYPVSDSLFAEVDRLPEQTAGVYTMMVGDAVSYVGESQDVRRHCETILNNSNWAQIGSDSIGLIVEPDADQRKLIQAALVQQEQAFLNCRLLMQESEL